MSGATRVRWLVAVLGAASLVGYGPGFAWVAAPGADWPGRYVALFAGLFAVYLIAARVAWRAPVPDRVLVGLILGFALGFRLVLLPTPTVLSSDVHRYLWDGRVQWAGVSPYRYPPEAAELAALRDPATHARINRPDKRTIYPPGAQLLFAMVAGAVPGSLLAWRLLLLGAEVLTAGLLLGLLRRMGVTPAAVIVYAWAPLAVFEGVQAAHLEVALLPAVLLGLRFRQAGHLARAGAALGAAVLLKLYPIVLLAAWWRRGDRRLPLACAAAVAAGYLPYAVGVGPGVAGFLPEYFSSAEDFNIGLRYFLTGWVPLDGVAREAVRGVTMLALAGGLVAALGWIARARREDPAEVFRATMAAAGAYLLLVPSAMHAWYATWMLPWLAVRPSAAWLWFTGAVALSYLKYGSASGALPLWARLVEYVPLYALLVWEWRTGRLALGARADAAAWRSGAAPALPSGAP